MIIIILSRTQEKGVQVRDDRKRVYEFLINKRQKRTFESVNVTTAL